MVKKIRKKYAWIKKSNKTHLPCLHFCKAWNICFPSERIRFESRIANIHQIPNVIYVPLESCTSLFKFTLRIFLLSQVFLKIYFLFANLSDDDQQKTVEFWCRYSNTFLGAKLLYKSVFLSPTNAWFNLF